MAIRNLTIDARSIQGDPVDVPITITLPSADWLRPDALSSGSAGSYAPNGPITARTNQQGVAVIPLAATQDFVGSSAYSVRIGSGRPFDLIMPDRDANLYQLTQTPAPPPSPAALPVGLTDGDVVIGQGGQYALKKQVHAGTVPPDNPATTALWWDTSTTPADLRYTLNAGTSWNEVREPADIAAALNSLTGIDRIDGAHIQGQVTPPVVTTLPATTGYRQGSFVIVQPAGQTATGSLYFLTGDVRVGVQNRNRIQFVIANNVIQQVPPATDNYNNILGSIAYDAPHRRITIRLDTGVGIEAPPDQLWVTGIETTGAIQFQVDPFQPYSYSGGRRYKQLRGTISASKAQAGINGPQTWLFYTDFGVTEGYDFKPPIAEVPGSWVEVTGGTGGGGLNATQVQALIADWAEQGNTDIVPNAKLASGGSTGQVLKRTATGREWAAETGGLDAAAVDARIKPYARTGGRTIATADIANDAINADKIAAGAVGGTEIADDSIGNAKLADDAVEAAQIADDAIGTAAIADNSVTPAKLDASARSRFVPAGGTAGQILEKLSATDYATRWVNAPSGGTGLDQAAVDARVRAGVKDYAEQGNTANKIPFTDLATGITDRLIPAGGTTNQVLAKSSASDYATQWVNAASGGAGTPLTVTPRSSSFTPSLASTALTPGTEVQINIAAGTIATNHPLSVTGNGIVVTTGTDPFIGTLQTKLAVDPTAWTSSATAGGNRLFLQSYWKKDGTIIEATRQDYYIRGDERYAPTEHIIVADATLSLSAGTYTLFVNKIGQAAAGNEINSIQINAGSSGITIVSADYSGGDVMTGGGGLDQAAVDARVRAGVADWAEDGNNDLLPNAKLASGGSTGQVLKRTATGREWAADAGGLTQTQVDARIKPYARAGGRSIQSGDIGTGQVGSAQIADATIVSGDIASDAITSANLAPNSVGASELANNAVDTAAIVNDAVTRAKIGANAIGSTELGANSVTTAKIPSLAITEAKLASNSVSERTIQDDAVRAAQIQAGAVGTSELANDAVTAAKIDTDAVGSAEIAAGAVGTSELANNAVTPAQVHSSLASRLVPAGGDNNQILAKSSDSDYATEWIDAPTGSGSGGNLVVTPLTSTFAPSLPATTLTVSSEVQINIAAGTIAADHPLSVSSNGIVVAAGTSPFLGSLRFKLELDPTAWANNANSGGNRLFLQSYWKKDGTIVEASRKNYYIRGDERYAPDGHLIVSDLEQTFNPGTWTLFIVKIGTQANGNEINAVQIAAAASTIIITSERYTGATVVGGIAEAAVENFAKTAQTTARVPVVKGGIPTGGTAGQVLTRQGASNVVWTLAPSVEALVVQAHTAYASAPVGTTNRTNLLTLPSGYQNDDRQFLILVVEARYQVSFGNTEPRYGQAIIPIPMLTNTAGVDQDVGSLVVPTISNGIGRVLWASTTRQISVELTGASARIIFCALYR